MSAAQGGAWRTAAHRPVVPRSPPLPTAVHMRLPRIPPLLLVRTTWRTSSCRRPGVLSCRLHPHPLLKRQGQSGGRAGYSHGEFERQPHRQPASSRTSNAARPLLEQIHALRLRHRLGVLQRSSYLLSAASRRAPPRRRRLPGARGRADTRAAPALRSATYTASWTTYDSPRTRRWTPYTADHSASTRAQARVRTAALPAAVAKWPTSTSRSAAA